MPYIPGEIEWEFDFRINLTDYFPFSIPRDILDLISVLSGGAAPETLGATAYQRILLEHYMETGELSPEGYALIAPLVVGNARPRFEANIPLPDFSGGHINADNANTAYTLVIDMDNHPTLMAVIRMSVFMIFLIALVNITPKVMLW
jgi:hypothetical protein